MANTRGVRQFVEGENVGLGHGGAKETRQGVSQGAGDQQDCRLADGVLLPGLGFQRGLQSFRKAGLQGVLWLLHAVLQQPLQRGRKGENGQISGTRRGDARHDLPRQRLPHRHQQGLRLLGAGRVFGQRLQHPAHPTAPAAPA